MNEPKPIDVKKYEGRDSFQMSNSVDESIHYNPIKTPVFFTRGQIFDANGRKVCNLPNTDTRPDLKFLAEEIVKKLNATS